MTNELEWWTAADDAELAVVHELPLEPRAKSAISALRAKIGC